ncbi:MAG: hypothetical protein QOJ27_1956 [Sphingomonadales bacterium]|nr:hypothetical protein [Sphingomonadales bacterium]
MPQPLSRVSPNPDIRIGLNAFKQLPDAAGRIIDVISIWSLIDSRLTIILAQMLKTDYEAAAAMYRAITSGQARRAALDAVSAHALAGPSFCLLQAVLKVTKPSRDTRNDFAHHVWGYDKNLSDALLLIPPDAIASLEIASRKHREAGNLSQHKVVMTEGNQVVIVSNAPTLDHSSVAVWRQKDFDRAASAARNADRYFAHLWIALSDSPVRDERRKLLFDDPAIDRAFETLSHKNEQAALLRKAR